MNIRLTVINIPVFSKKSKYFNSFVLLLFRFIISTMNPKLNYNKNYISTINNAVGTNLFKNLYMLDDNGVEFDAADGGNRSCALFVTGLLKMFDRIDNMHATASGTLKYVSSASDWEQTDEPHAGDLIFWSKTDTTTGHVGFYVGPERAISINDNEGVASQHSLTLRDGRAPVSFWHFKG